MTSYSKEFEKWLNSSSSLNLSDELKDEQEGTVNASSHLYAYDDGGGIGEQQTDEDSLESLAELRNSASTKSPCLDHTAPILLDDEEVSNEDKEFLPYYMDEPPVLEPVSKLSSRIKIALIPKVTQPKPFVRHSRVHQSYSRQRSLQEKEMKTYSTKEKIRHTQSDDFEKRHTKNVFVKNNRESGNIFDKFLFSNSYDSPPPLIPSPEALKLRSVTQKHPGQSPNFCAMEADSTSELISEQCHTHQFNQSKSCSDMSVECDSTCMLGASPAIVSPASVSAVDSEDVREMLGSDSVENDVVKYTGSEVDLLDNCRAPFSDKALNVIIPVHQSVEKQCIDSEGSQQLLVHISDTNISYDEPPTLSVMSPLRVSHVSSRHKRHTIDAPETFSRTHKQHHLETTESPQFYSTPPTLICVNETSNQLRCKRINLDQNYDNAIDYPIKRRRRHCTYPLTDETYQNSDEQHNFVANACLLSQLQTKMHLLLMLIFPQIEKDLKKISPESLLLANILSDLLNILQLQKQNDSINSKNSSRACNLESAVSYDVNNSKLNNCKNIQLSGCFNSNFSSPKVNTKVLINPCDKSFHHKSSDNELAISQLSRLSIQEPKYNIKPLVIILIKNPETQLKHFSILCCQILQLLLPDISVSLCEELADSPKDLIVFLDNIVKVNSRVAT